RPTTKNASSEMPETDLILMSLCICLPTVCAAILLFIPKGMEEFVRWFTLAATASTFVLSTIIFINYLDMLKERSDDTAFTRPDVKTTLLERAKAQDAREAK